MKLTSNLIDHENQPMAKTQRHDKEKQQMFAIFAWKIIKIVGNFFFIDLLIN